MVFVQLLGQNQLNVAVTTIGGWSGIESVYRRMVDMGLVSLVPDGVGMVSAYRSAPPVYVEIWIHPYVGYGK